MKLFLFAVALLALGAIAEALRSPINIRQRLQRDMHREPPVTVMRSTRNLPYQFLDQRIDNFDPQNYATYQQAYFENDEHFAAGGPLFVYIGGEWNITAQSILGGHLFDLAAEFNATLLYPEHRYYGISHPFSQLTADNLRFLSVEQALADLASFIVQIKRRNARYADSPVIVVGGSYSATMAAWFRKQYPHLTVGAWASSAPVLAKAAFVEYKEIVGGALGNLGGSACYTTIEEAYAQAEQLIADGRTEEFREAFGLCKDFGTHRLDASNILSLVSDVFAGVVQYHNSTNMTIQSTCRQLAQHVRAADGDTFAGFRAFFAEQVDLEDGECLDNYLADVQTYRQTALNSVAVRSGGRQWFYQTCTEFGWYQTSESDFHPFGSGFPVELYYSLCRDVYGDRFDERFVNATIDRTNVVFGGWSLDVSNVYFTNGLVDPWRAMGVQEDLNESSPADVIPDASHCNDLRSVSEFDNEEMLAVKERVRVLFGQWLAL